MTEREKLRQWLDAVESGVCADCERVAVIRCKDCKHYEPYYIKFSLERRGDGNCKLKDANTEDNGFCNYGKNTSE